MMCYSAHCCGPALSAKGVEKLNNVFLRNCPDCGHALVQKRRKFFKMDKASWYKKDAVHGNKTRNVQGLA